MILNNAASEVDVSVVDESVVVGTCVEVSEVVKLSVVDAEEVVVGGSLKVVSGMVDETVIVDDCVKASDVVDCIKDVLKVVEVVSDDKVVAWVVDDIV